MAVEIITTVLVPASAAPPLGPYDLTTLENVHQELQLKDADTSMDPWLQRAISQASLAIKHYCKTTFQVETLQDQIFIQQDAFPWQNPGLIFPLQLSRRWLSNFAVVAFTGVTNGTVNVTGIASTAGLLAGMPVFAADGSLPAGTLIASVASNAITLSNAASSSVTAESFTTGVSVIQLLSAGQTNVLTYGVDFTIDAKKGWLIRLDSFTGVAVGWEAIPVTVIYQAGFATVPDDLEEACLRLVTARYTARGRDPLMQEFSQPNVGTKRWWVGTTPGQATSLPLDIQGMLDDHYRVKTAA